MDHKFMSIKKVSMSLSNYKDQKFDIRYVVFVLMTQKQ